MADSGTQVTFTHEPDLGASAAASGSPGGERPIDPGLEPNLFWASHCNYHSKVNR